MRFSALQDNGCGVNVPQDRLPSVFGGGSITVTSNTEEDKDMSVDEGAMVSNLPLLFSNGYPTSLETITMAQLERFINFMVHCSLGHDTAKVISKPPWWPKEVKFSNPLVRPSVVNDNWMGKLKKLVFRCYTYHRSEYLLRFCSYLAQYPRDELHYVNNWDSTTSLYHKSTGKLLVSFRNENLYYDRTNENPRKSENPRKKLLSHNNSAAAGHSSKSKQLQQHALTMLEPPDEDIYLCDNCDAEFVGLGKMKEHENTCCEQEQGCSNSRPNTPDDSNVEPEASQNQFLEYFYLRSNKAEPAIVERNFGSPMNNHVPKPKKTKAMTEETQQERLERIERHSSAPILKASSKPKWMNGEPNRDRWIVTYKHNREKSFDDYVHEYKFVNSVKRKPMLSIQSQLLYIVCRPVNVLLTRLSEEQIHELKQDPSKNRYSIETISVDGKAEKGSGGISQTATRASASSKRKAPGDESDSNEAERGTEINLLGMNKVALTTCKVREQPEVRTSQDVLNNQKYQDTGLRAKLSHIAVIDLCSSDDEDPSIPSPCDENRDPMNNTTDVEVKNSVLRKLAVTKLCSKSCIYPSDATTDWLPDNILNDDCENRYRSTNVLNTCALRSPILRPAP